MAKDLMSMEKIRDALSLTNYVISDRPCFPHWKAFHEGYLLFPSKLFVAYLRHVYLIVLSRMPDAYQNKYCGSNGKQERKYEVQTCPQ